MHGFCATGYNSASETKKHDADAIRYLSYVLYPILICYAGYTLYYETHKSWYSFVLNTLVGAVYTFGFILMCPQVSLPSLSCQLPLFLTVVAGQGVLLLLACFVTCCSAGVAAADRQTCF